MDAHLRHILTAQGGIDHCVTEFIRITHGVYPRHVFLRYCPELNHGGRTHAGTPVHVQLLGSNIEMMAANAAKAVELGAPAIDLNFGCPAKTVNKSMGGSVLLQYPQTVHDIAYAVRQAVPKHIPVSAKMRLGYRDKQLAIDNAVALNDSGINWLTVHARTKLEGYQPPAHWEWIARIKQCVSVPVLANGEIWSAHNADACMAASNSRHLMIGRGLVSIPDLAMRIKHAHHKPQDWQARLALLLDLMQQLHDQPERLVTNRLKQWLHYFAMQSPELGEVFQALKRAKHRSEFASYIEPLLADH